MALRSVASFSQILMASLAESFSKNLAAPLVTRRSMFHPVGQVDKFGGVVLGGATELGSEGLHFFICNPGHEDETQL